MMEGVGRMRCAPSKKIQMQQVKETTIRSKIFHSLYMYVKGNLHIINLPISHSN